MTPQSSAATATKASARLFAMPAEFEVVDEIHTVEQLTAHLKVAAQLEMSTIPPYLYAAYSIRTRGYSQWSPGRGALRTIIGIAVEEMLHLCLVRNLLLAIGEDITFCSPDFIPTYPGAMPHRQPELIINLERLSRRVAKNTFMAIEEPTAPPTDDLVKIAGDVDEYATIGEFYRRIIKGFQYLDKHKKITWDRAGVNRQYRRGYWNQNGGGEPLTVNDLKTALEAINEIIDQGEGADPAKGVVPTDPIDPQAGLEEFTHYVKFERIYNRVEGIGIGDGEQEKEVDIDSPLAVAMLATNPKVADFARKSPDQPWPTEPLWELMTLFNAAFSYTLYLLDQLYAHPSDDIQPNGSSARYHLERIFVGAMQGVLYPIADLLTRTPTGRRHTVKGQKVDEYAGPSFEYYQFGTGPYAGTDREAELADLCARAARHFPELGGDDGVQRQISLLTPAVPS
jgi:hypothetical protein